MRHIKKFESFDLGRFSEEEEGDLGLHGTAPEEVECEPCDSDEEGREEEEGDYFYSEEGEEVTEEEEEMRRKVWGDEATVERVASFSNFLREAKKAKPDFLDLDKDGNKKESMKKAAKDAKEDKKDNKKEDKKADKKDDKKADKKDDAKKPKFGSKEWREMYAKK